MLQEKWLQEWHEKKSDIISLSRRFSELTDFNRIVGDFKSANLEEPVFQLEERVHKLEVGNLKHPGYFSCKVMDSGMDVIEAVLEALSDGKSGVFIRGNVLFGPTEKLFEDRYESIKVDLRKPENLEKALAKLKKEEIPVLGIFYETLSNPTLDFADTFGIALIARDYGVSVIADNTLLTPYLYEPARRGADIIIESLAKYYNGDGYQGGAVIAPNEFIREFEDYMSQYRMIEPDVGYEIAKRVSGLGKRMDKHQYNSTVIAEGLKRFLKGMDIKVFHPYLDYETRDGMCGGLISFAFKGKGASKKAEKFAEHAGNFNTFKVKGNFGEQETLVFPWHKNRKEEGWPLNRKVPSGLVRIAAGREKLSWPVMENIVDYIKKIT